MKSGKARRVIERLARADVHAPRSSARGRELGLTEGDLASALAHGELLLHYQPIVDVRSGACRRVDALSRTRTGTYEALFGPTAPKGEYEFRASSRGVDAAATVRT